MYNNLRNFNKRVKDNKRHSSEKLLGYIVENGLGNEELTLVSLKVVDAEVKYINENFDNFLEHKHADNIKITWFGFSNSYKGMLYEISQYHNTKTLQQEKELVLL